MKASLQQNGFTLVEMLMAVAIVAILAAISYPAYQDRTMKTKRADGKAELLGLKLAQEKLRVNCPFYAQNIGASDSCGDSAATTTVAYRTTSSEGFYNLSIVADSASGVAFTLQADPTGSQVADTDCDPLTLTVSGANPMGAQGPAVCWD